MASRLLVDDAETGHRRRGLDEDNVVENQVAKAQAAPKADGQREGSCV
jgi:hypothetical protein